MNNRFTTGSLLGAALALFGTAAMAQQADDALLERGEYLTRAADCLACHVTEGGKPYAGGLPVEMPFGTLYSTNITPDKETGIGNWTDDEFVEAMQKGVGPDGRHYYPAFPYTSYTLMPREDILAIKAYLFSLEPVNQPNRENDIGFPFNQRWGIALWNLLFLDDERFEPDPQQSAQWNRGAYLVLGPGHCGECHTPRTFYGVLEEDRAFAGARLGKEQVPNLTSDPEAGLGKWSAGDIGTALKIGMLPDGDFVGSEMAKVVNNATSKLPDEDIAAIATFLKSLPPRK